MSDEKIPSIAFELDDVEVDLDLKKKDHELKAKFWGLVQQQPWYAEGMKIERKHVRQLMRTSTLETRWKNPLYGEWFLNNNTGKELLLSERDNMIKNLIEITQDANQKTADRLKAMSMAFDMMGMNQKQKAKEKFLDQDVSKMEEHDVVEELKRSRSAREETDKPD